jgi:hypothetical protein
MGIRALPVSPLAGATIARTIPLAEGVTGIAVQRLILFLAERNNYVLAMALGLTKPSASDYAFFCVKHDIVFTQDVPI